VLVQHAEYGLRLGLSTVGLVQRFKPFLYAERLDISKAFPAPPRDDVVVQVLFVGFSRLRCLAFTAREFLRLVVLGKLCDGERRRADCFGIYVQSKRLDGLTRCGLRWVLLFWFPMLHWLAALFGGFDAARVWHFWLMWLFLLFVVPQVILVLADGWDTLRGMIVGWSTKQTGRRFAQVINEEKDHSFGSEDISSTGSGSNLETVKFEAVGSADTKPTAPAVAETRQAVESIEQPANADGQPSSPVGRAQQTDEAASSVPAKQELAEAGSETTTPSAPKAIEKSEIVEAIQQPADADGAPSLSVDHKPQMEEAASSAVVKSASVEIPQGFLGEQPLPMVEVAPLVLRYRTRRDLLLFGAGAVAGVAGAGLLLPQATLDRLGVRRNIDSRGKEWLLNKAVRIDEDVAEALYSANHIVPTYTKSQITPIKNNYNGATPRPRLYIGMEPDSGGTRFWLERLSRHSEAHESLLDP
jgi:hypothetical protein